MLQKVFLLAEKGRAQGSVMARPPSNSPSLDPAHQFFEFRVPYHTARGRLLDHVVAAQADHQVGN